MVCFGAVLVKHFYGETKPITTNWNNDTLSISDISREMHEQFGEPKKM